MHYLTIEELAAIKKCGAYSEAIKIFSIDEFGKLYIHYSRIDWLIDILQEYKATKCLIKHFNEILMLNGDFY